MARVLRFDAGSLQKPRRTSQGYLVVDGWASRTGILEYRNPDGTPRRELREDDAVYSDDSLNGFLGAPVTDDHPSDMVTIANSKAVTKGTVLTVGRRDGDHVAVTLQITDPDLIRKMETGKRQLSTGYYVELDETPGVHPKYGRYDARQVRVGPVNHLAVVDRGRAGTAAVRMDSWGEQTEGLVEISPEVPADVVARLEALAKRIDEWNEEDHPRAENGQFGSGGGGSKGGGERNRDFSSPAPKVKETKSSEPPTLLGDTPGGGGKGIPQAKHEPSGEKFGLLGDNDDRPEPAKAAPKGVKLSDSSATVRDLAAKHGAKGPMGKDFEALVEKHGLNDEHHNGELHLGANSLAAKAAETAKNRPTYAKAKTQTLEGLKSAGWTVKDNLKVPHATSPDGSTRLWFKSQAVWKSKLGEGGGYDNSKHSLASASSTFEDIRDHAHNPEAYAAKHWKAKKDSVALDLHDANPVPHSESATMTLDEALARIKDLETKLDALEAAPADAAPEGKKCPECGAMNAADATTCEKCGASLGGESKMDAANVARLEGERDAARTDAEEAKKALAAATEAHATELAKVRKDAEESAVKTTREAVDVVTKARAVLGVTAKLKLDGKDVDLVEAPLRDVKCAVVKHVKGKTVEAKKADAYVDALFEDAIEAFAKGAGSAGAARQVVEAPRQDAVDDTKPVADPEKAAMEANKNRISSAWMATETK